MNRRMLLALALALALALLAALGAAGLGSVHGDTSARQLSKRVAAIAPPGTSIEISCAALHAQNPIGVLVLGQSNAGNHGEPGALAGAKINTVYGGRCYSATDPLPGATGSGASLWPRVAVALGHRLQGRPLVFTIIAVESTTIADWTKPGALRYRLDAELERLRRTRLAVDLVLWQQGEADTKAGTTQAAYVVGLASLQQGLSKNGINAPILAALSTYCPGSDGSSVRSAIHTSAAAGRGILLGPNTDELQGTKRVGCHFSASGLDAAARLWALALQATPDSRFGSAINTLAPSLASGASLASR